MRVTDMPVVVLSANIAWNIINFRMGLVRALQERGIEVVVLAGADETVASLREHGVRVEALPIASRGVNPFGELLLFAAYLRRLRALTRRARVLAYLGFTIKPNIYGSVAARICGVPVIANIAGLGALFSRPGARRTAALAFYRFALRGVRRVYFQNGSDRLLFLSRRVVDRRRSALIPGSGVDLDRFNGALAADGFPGEPGRRRFVLIARLLWEKGIDEYVRAARSVRERYPDARFALVGFSDGGGRAAVPARRIAGWVSEGVIAYLGRAADVRPAILGADCIVLPSTYREGTPRVLLEAAAMSRPVVTTDTPGCRDAVLPGESGYLCRPGDAGSLAERIIEVLELPADRLREMGRAGRRHVERRFDERLVVGAYLREIEELGG